MKKFLIHLFLIFIISSCCSSANAFFHKKEKPQLFLSSYDPKETSYEQKIENYSVFRVNSRIYFLIYSKEGFKSEYLKYQIVHQDDNAHEGGYNRIKNETVKTKDKHVYVDYFIITTPGKYFIQVFDITNLHQWLAIGAFRVVEN